MLTKLDFNSIMKIIRFTFSGFIAFLIIYCHLVVEGKRSRKLDDKGCGSVNRAYLIFRIITFLILLLIYTKHKVFVNFFSQIIITSLLNVMQLVDDGELLFLRMDVIRLQQFLQNVWMNAVSSRFLFHLIFTYVGNDNNLLHLDKSCDAGRFLNMTTMQCEECEPGTYSMGGGIRYEEWDPLPNGFEVNVEKFHSAFSPASRQYSAVDCSK